MNGSTSRQNKPVYLCILGVLPAILAIAGFLLWREDVVDRGSLKQVSGRVTAFDCPPMGRARVKGPRLFLEDKSDGNKLYVAEQNIPSDRFPSLQTLRPGDQVTALVRTHELTTTSSLWEVRRGSEILLSFDQTRLCLKREANVMLLLTSFTATAALVCLAAGVGTRWYTGSWG